MVIYLVLQMDHYVIGAVGVANGRGALYSSNVTTPTMFMSGNNIEPNSETGIPDPTINSQYQGLWLDLKLYCNTVHLS